MTAFKTHLSHKFEAGLDWWHFKALVCEYFSGSSLSRMKGRRTASLLLETTKDFLIWQRWPEHLADLEEMAWAPLQIARSPTLLICHVHFDRLSPLFPRFSQKVVNFWQMSFYLSLIFFVFFLQNPTCVGGNNWPPVRFIADFSFPFSESPSPWFLIKISAFRF